MALSRGTRRKAMEAGIYVDGRGELHMLDQMPDGYLINALLKALAEGEGRQVTDPMTAEIMRRGLEEEALRVAAERGPTFMKGGEA